MLSALLRSTKKSTFLCMCMLAVLFSALGVSPAHATRHEARILEFFLVTQSNVHHTISVIDNSKTLTEEACNSAPQAKEWSKVRYAQTDSSHDCSITTVFERYTNPYVGVDQDGNVTFAAKPTALEEMNLGLPADMKVVNNRVDFSGSQLTVTKVSPGAQLDERNEMTDSARWTDNPTEIVAAEGTMQILPSFHVIERKDFSGIQAVDLPNNLSDVQHTRTVKPYTLSPTPTSLSQPTPTSGLSALFRPFVLPALLVMLIIAIFFFIKRANKKRTERETQGFTIPVSYQPAPLPVDQQTVGNTGRNPFRLPTDDASSAPEISTENTQFPAEPTLFSPSSAQTGLTNDELWENQGRNPYAPPSE